MGQTGFQKKTLKADKDCAKPDLLLQKVRPGCPKREMALSTKTDRIADHGICHEKCEVYTRFMAFHHYRVLELN